MTRAPSYTTDNYATYEMRGGGYLLRRINDGRECFFQPGDDAGTMRESVDAIDELPPTKQDEIFDYVCSQYDDMLDQSKPTAAP